MLKVKSELNGRLCDCTIATGIVMANGERIGAMADIDVFACFTVDMRDAITVINKREGLSIPLPPWKDNDLWRVEKRGKNARFDLDKQAKVSDNSRESRVERLAARLAAGLELCPGSDDE